MSGTDRPDRFSDTAPDMADIESIAVAAFESISASLRKSVSGVLIRVEEFPNEEVMADLGINNPYDLLGLYHGVDLTQKSFSETPEDVDMIFLYRRPILNFWIENDVPLGDVVRHLFIQEIGHNLGFS